MLPPVSRPPAPTLRASVSAPVLRSGEPQLPPLADARAAAVASPAAVTAVQARTTSASLSTAEEAAEEEATPARAVRPPWEEAPMFRGWEVGLARSGKRSGRGSLAQRAAAEEEAARAAAEAARAAVASEPRRAGAIGLPGYLRPYRRGRRTQAVLDAARAPEFYKSLSAPRVSTPEAMSEAEREAVGEYERAWVEGLAARGAQQASWRHLGRR